MDVGIGSVFWDVNALPLDTSHTNTSWQNWISERGERFFLYARQRTFHEEDARDVLQEALVEAWRRSQGQLPPDALVFATIRRRSIDHHRSSGSRRSREERFAAEEETWFQPDVAESDTHRVLSEALRNLPEHLGETVVLKLWGGLTFPEIAELTGVPVATATSRYRYALDQLRSTLSPLLS